MDYFVDNHQLKWVHFWGRMGRGRGNHIKVAKGMKYTEVSKVLSKNTYHKSLLC